MKSCNVLFSQNKQTKYSPQNQFRYCAWHFTDKLQASDTAKFFFRVLVFGLVQLTTTATAAITTRGGHCWPDAHACVDPFRFCRTSVPRALWRLSWGGGTCSIVEFSPWGVTSLSEMARPRETWVDFVWLGDPCWVPFTPKRCVCGSIFGCPFIMSVIWTDIFVNSLLIIGRSVRCSRGSLFVHAPLICTIRFRSGKLGGGKTLLSCPLSLHFWSNASGTRVFAAGAIVLFIYPVIQALLSISFWSWLFPYSVDGL